MSSATQPRLTGWRLALWLLIFVVVVAVVGWLTASFWLGLLLITLFGLVTAGFVVRGRR